MFKKLVFIIFIVFFFTFIIYSQKVFAKNDNLDSNFPPEKEGTYDVSGHPNLKVKVFIHHPKDIRPIPTPTTPTITCPNDDVNSTALVPALKWKLPSNWNYTLNISSVPTSVDSKNLPIIAEKAFYQWTNAPGFNINIARTSLDTTINRSRLDGVNIIAWGRASNSALAITYTWYYPSTGLVAEVDTIINQQFPWFWNADNNMCTDQRSYDVQNILTHELGHWMGLDDRYTSEFVNNTMYGYGSKGETKKDTLTSGDINGVSSIYLY